jgi:hypothetical protein
MLSQLTDMYEDSHNVAALMTNMKRPIVAMMHPQDSGRHCDGDPGLWVLYLNPGDEPSGGSQRNSHDEPTDEDFYHHSLLFPFYNYQPVLDIGCSDGLLTFQGLQSSSVALLLL